MSLTRNSVVSVTFVWLTHKQADHWFDLWLTSSWENVGGILVMGISGQFSAAYAAGYGCTRDFRHEPDGPGSFSSTARDTVDYIPGTSGHFVGPNSFTYVVLVWGMQKEVNTVLWMLADERQPKGDLTSYVFFWISMKDEVKKDWDNQQYHSPLYRWSPREYTF